MQITARGLVYDAAQAPADRCVCCFTSVRVLHSGAVLCSFQVGRSKHSPQSTIGLCRSDDGGNTWRSVDWQFPTVRDGKPGSLAAAEIVEPSPGRLLLFTTWYDRTDPARPLFDPQTEGLLHSQQLMAVSTDEGRTWSDWHALDTGELTGCATTGPALQWPDGTVAYAFESFKHYDDPRPARHGAWLLVSRDGGRSFAPPLLVARDPEHARFFWDQRLCPLPTPGGFFGLFWTHDRARQRDLHVHQMTSALAELPTAVLPTETTMGGQIAAALSDEGVLYAFVVDRQRPCTLKLWRSRDGGRTWPADEALVVYAHDERAALAQRGPEIDFAQYWEDMGKWSFGHPAICKLPSGELLLSHYAGTPERMSVHWVRVRA